MYIEKEFKNKLVAYFCAEFAIDNELPTYAGGLGVLAADLISAASRENFPMVGIGILYKGKDFIQHLTGDSKEERRDSQFDHDTSFLRQTLHNGSPLKIEFEFGNSKVYAKSYHLRLADNTILFFLSTNVDGNPPEWISDMDTLYSGDTNSIIRQQILLGIGGVKLLDALNLTPKLYHLNEGRPCFAIWEIVAQKMKKEGLDFKTAWEKAKNSILYTNHTLLPAGNLTYPKSAIEPWADFFSNKIDIDRHELIKDGLIDQKTFSITKFALETSSKQNAVSKVHKKFAKKQWPNQNWISITNGVDVYRWQDSDYRSGNLSDNSLWELHMSKKRELAATVLNRTGFTYDPERLVISWSRRLAEYKQPKAIFENIQRLKTIVTNHQRPVQLLFAGNSHSRDTGAKSLIEEVIHIFNKDLSGHAIFVPNNNISLANHLVSGSDVWLNTPKINMEACGTSGMKALSNGVLNCTVLDGWTHEINWEGMGWVLDPDNISESIYQTIEREIIPEYYQRDNNNIPVKWVSKMRKSIEASQSFSAEKMLENYKKLFYKVES
jgi:glycogen phosphorylase